MEKLQNENILLNILVRLPVKSILRFRCVTKAWCKLSKDPYFVKKHLTHTIEMDKFSVMMQSEPSFHKDRIFTLAYDPFASTLSNCVAINYPSHCNGITIWGTCNGLICLSPGSDSIVLWNPATKEFKEVPIEYPDDEWCYVIHGFGTYNDEFDDFKVVRFEGVEDEYFCQVQVYTLKSNSWQRLENIPYQLSRGDMEAQVIVDGAMHCLADTTAQNNKSVIVSFDFKDDKFNEMPLPNFLNEFDGVIHLCSLGGSLCLLGSIFQGRVEVWEMKTYGVTESWAKLFTIGQETICEFFYKLVPLRFVKNDQVLLGYDTDVDFRLDLYYLKRGTSINLKAHANDQDTYGATTFVYVESLVMLNSGTYVGLPEIDSEEDFKDSEEDFKYSEEDFEESDVDFGEEEDIY